MEIDGTGEKRRAKEKEMKEVFEENAREKEGRKWTKKKM